MSRLVCALVLVLGALPIRATAEELTVLVHDSFSISKETVARFEAEHNCTVRFLQGGDAGLTLNQAILTKHAPLADVLFGVDNTFLSRALKEDLFEPYRSPALARVRPELVLDPEHRVTPIDFGDVCLNYDRAWFAAQGMTPPQDIMDLMRPEYARLLVVENPATSSPGLAFLLTTIARFGEDEAFAFWEKLKAGGVLVRPGWKDAYWGDFTAASKGQRPIVVSYATSPAAEVYFGKNATAEAPTAAVLTPGAAFRQVEFAGILKGTKHPELARRWIDFMLSDAFQEDIPLQMFVFPAVHDVRLPEVFTRHARMAESPAWITPERIAAHREAWIARWNRIMTP